MASPPSPSAPAGASTDYIPPRKRGSLIAIVIALLVATNAVTALAVYYSVPAAPTPPGEPAPRPGHAGTRLRVHHASPGGPPVPPAELVRCGPGARGSDLHAECVR